MLHGVTISFLHTFRAGDGADKHKQRGFRQVKVRDDIINDFELVARGDENIRFSGEGMQNAVIISGTFQ